jgi:hypothetical protein
MMRCYVALFFDVVSIKYRKEVIGMKENTKKVWSTPVVVEYGSVETLTQVQAAKGGKRFGFRDDFGRGAGVSNP